MSETRATSSPIVRVTTATFEREVLQSPVPVVVDFWAPWCIYCKKLAPVYEAAAPKFDQLRFATVNVDEERALAERFGIMSLPTLKVFCGGRDVGEMVGYMPSAQLEATFQGLADHANECMKNSNPIRR